MAKTCGRIRAETKPPPCSQRSVHSLKRTPLSFLGRDLRGQFAIRKLREKRSEKSGWGRGSEKRNLTGDGTEKKGLDHIPHVDMKSGHCSRVHT